MKLAMMPLTQRPGIFSEATSTPSDKSILKEQFQQCLGPTGSRTSKLRGVIRIALKSGVSFDELVVWAVEFGYQERHARKILSRLLLEAGVRRRKKGAGPQKPQEAHLVVAIVRHLYARRTLKLLRAACGIAQAQDELEQENALVSIGDKDEPIPQNN